MIDSHSYRNMIGESKLKELMEYDDTLNTTIHDHLRFVAWFHDCYYDPYSGSPTNERISMEIFRAMVIEDPDALANMRFISNVAKNITLTASHLADVRKSGFSSVGAEHLIFMDLDMHGFCVESEFNRNNITIKKEYYKSTEEEYLKGRIGFLSKLLEKDRIYYLYEDEHEDAARANIKRGLSESIDELDAIL